MVGSMRRVVIITPIFHPNASNRRRPLAHSTQIIAARPRRKKKTQPPRPAGSPNRNHRKKFVRADMFPPFTSLPNRPDWLLGRLAQDPVTTFGYAGRLVNIWYDDPLT